MRDLFPGDRLDQYEIKDLLARGGMASLFTAVDTDSGRTVVLKIPHLQYESDVVFYERFKREEEIGQRCDHPNVVKVLTPREKSGMYLAMEYVEGHSLRDELRRGVPLSVERALEIARQLCAALSYLHRNGVVHRDVKPENVLLASRDGSVKLLDFGIAFLEAARRLTWTGLSGTVGTPDYMAPEQTRGRRGSARSDVYAIGTILYEMLTGRLPYDAPDAGAMLRIKARSNPTPPREWVREIPSPLEAVVLKAIACDPRVRYADADELLGDLREPYGEASRARAASDADAPGVPGGDARHALLAAIVAGAVLAGLAWFVR